MKYFITFELFEYLEFLLKFNKLKIEQCQHRIRFWLRAAPATLARTV
jgi:hypothetical protein